MLIMMGKLPMKISKKCAFDICVMELIQAQSTIVLQNKKSVQEVIRFQPVLFNKRIIDKLAMEVKVLDRFSINIVLKTRIKHKAQPNRKQAIPRFRTLHQRVCIITLKIVNTIVMKRSQPQPTTITEIQIMSLILPRINSTRLITVRLYAKISKIKV